MLSRPREKPGDFWGPRSWGIQIKKKNDGWFIETIESGSDAATSMTSSLDHRQGFFERPSTYRSRCLIENRQHLDRYAGAKILKINGHELSPDDSEARLRHFGLHRRESDRTKMDLSLSLKQ